MAGKDQEPHGHGQTISPHDDNRDDLVRYRHQCYEAIE